MGALELDLIAHVDLLLEKDVELLGADEKPRVEINSASGFTKEFYNAENYFFYEGEVQHDSIMETELLMQRKFFDFQNRDAYMTVIKLENWLFFLEIPEDLVCTEEVV